MEWILVLLCIAAFIIGFVLGNKPKKKEPETVGTLYIDVSQSEDPYLYTQLYADPTEIEWDTHATFDVKIIK